ncbi:hypothetical protein E3W21_12880 [Pseudomonas sp. F01002]|nr:hypothetical protein E3W21_12880 [Pseudomonas sp. F01002]
MRKESEQDGIHDQRPVALSPELAREWLDPAMPTERDEEIVLLQGEPAEAFEWIRVNTTVGKVRSQGPDLIKRDNKDTLHL